MVLIYVLVVCFSDKEIHTYTKLLLIGWDMRERDAIVKTHKKQQKSASCSQSLRFSPFGVSQVYLFFYEGQQPFVFTLAHTHTISRSVSSCLLSRTHHTLLSCAQRLPPNFLRFASIFRLSCKDFRSNSRIRRIAPGTSQVRSNFDTLKL